MTTAIINGKIYVERGRFAEAVLVGDGIICLVGTNAEVRAAAPAGCEVIDAGGRTVLPGINDSHMHLMNVGLFLSTCDMSGARSVDEVVARGRAFLRENPESTRDGMLCFGYNQDYFEGEKRLLNRRDLDRISTEVPVVLRRVCGHIASTNTRAIRAAGIAADTPQPEGGAFGIGADGEPDGVFKETAIDLIMRVFPAPTPAQLEAMMRRAMEYAVRMGITSVQSNDAAEDGAAAHFALMRRLADEGKMLLRYRHQISITDPNRLAEFLETEYRDGWYTEKMVALGPLKLFKDGSLGARTALMRRDYADEPGNRGVDTLAHDRFGELVRIAAAGGMQVIAHAIGDAAIDEVIGHYESVIGAGRNALRHGVVHYQITDAAMHARMAKSGILAFVQPIFLDYDMRIVADRVGGALAETSYAFGTLSRTCVPVSYGTDAPVENPNPFRCIYCAVARKDLAGHPAGGFYPAECVDVCEAVDRYTKGSAYAAFQEHVKGRIAPGFLADMIVLDRDIFTILTDEIPKIGVDLTMVGGKVIYQR